MISGEKIRKIRESKGISRAELSRRSGISIRTLENWEFGKRTPRDFYIIDTLVTALGIDVSEICSDEYLAEQNAIALDNSERAQNESVEEMQLIQKIESIYERENTQGLLKIIDRFIYATGVKKAIKIVEEYIDESSKN